MNNKASEYTKYLIVIILILSNLQLLSQNFGDYRSCASGVWDSIQIWQTYNGSSWVNASNYPQDDEEVFVFISDGDTIILDSGNTSNSKIKMFINKDAVIEKKSASGTYYFDTIILHGTFVNYSLINIKAGLCVDSTGIYENYSNFYEFTIPNALWKDGSTLKLLGTITGIPNATGDYYNVIIAGRINNHIYLYPNFENIRGDFIISNPINNPGSMRRVYMQRYYNPNFTMHIGGNLVLEGYSHFQMSYSYDYFREPFLNIKGNIIVNDGAKFLADFCKYTLATINIGGSIYAYDGSFFGSCDSWEGYSNLTINFTKYEESETNSEFYVTNNLCPYPHQYRWHINVKSNKTLKLLSDIPLFYQGVFNPVFNVTVDSAATLDLNGFVIKDAANNIPTDFLPGFYLNPYGELKIHSQNGISQSGNDGEIQNTGVRSFSTKAKYHYCSNYTQETGDALPDTVMCLMISNGDTLNLSNSLSITDSLILQSGIIQLNQNNILFNNTSYADRGSSESFIKTNSTGKVYAINADSEGIFLPIGNSTYNPIGIINNTGIPDTYSVSVIDTVYQEGLSGEELELNKINRTWNITKNLPNSGNGTSMTFFWNNDHITGELIDKELYHYSGEEWELVNGVNIYQDSCTVTNYQGSFSPFSIFSREYYLPVELIDFKVECSKDTYVLNWTTASEINNDFFTIEKSYDAINFFESGIVYGSGNANYTIDYEYIDFEKKPFSVYYRLKQTDYNGDFSYSKIISANCDEKQSDVSFYIHNSQLIIKTSGIVNGYYKIILIDSTGKSLLAKTINKNDEVIQIEVPNLSTGIYYIKIFNELESYSDKLYYQSN